MHALKKNQDYCKSKSNCEFDGILTTIGGNKNKGGVQ